jgi:hypothetical protein
MIKIWIVWLLVDIWLMGIFKMTNKNNEWGSIWDQLRMILFKQIKITGEFKK